MTPADTLPLVSGALLLGFLLGLPCGGILLVLWWRGPR